jgi:ribosome-associated heat shock protein Hsp15
MAGNYMQSGMDGRHRLDLWLKLVCFFKHRGDATEACRGGHVKLNGQRAKPAAIVKEGDVVEFYLAERHRKVIVTGLPVANISKEAARTMYIDESPAPPKADVIVPMARDRGAGRPTRKERRDIEKWRG